MDGMLWVRIGAISAALAVAAGAFGAHGLRETLEASGRAATFETAVRYHVYHALALVAVGLLGLHAGRGTALEVAGWSFLAGTVLFSGSLYGLSLSGPRWLGPITPLGGGAFIVGWIALALAARGDAAKGVW
jgi:uncharacterized membrane protein YgdD (TMEM256/DUF423 family)